MTYTIKQIGYALTVLLGCLSLAIFMTVNSVWLFDLNMGPLHLGEVTGLTRSQMHAEYMRMINYIQNPFNHSLKFEYFLSSNAGLQHFKDVRHLVMFNNLMMVIFVPLTIFCLWRLTKKSLTWLLITPIKVVVSLSLVIIAMMLINFEQVFIFFHELLFRNRDWIFDPNSDPVINMLPDTFFLECFGLFFGLFLALNVMIYVLAKRSLDVKPSDR